MTFEFHAIVELLCKALRIGTISLRNVRGLLIDFNKPTVTMTFYVWKSNRQKGKKEDNSAKTKDVHMSATNPSFWGRIISLCLLISLLIYKTILRNHGNHYHPNLSDHYCHYHVNLFHHYLGLSKYDVKR